MSKRFGLFSTLTAAAVLIASPALANDAQKTNGLFGYQGSKSVAADFDKRTKSDDRVSKRKKKKKKKRRTSTRRGSYGF